PSGIVGSQNQNRTARMACWRALPLVCLAVLTATATSARPSPSASAGPAQLAPAQPPAAVDAAGQNVIIKSQYRRLIFPQDIQRIAVGDTEILSADVISSR